VNYRKLVLLLLAGCWGAIALGMSGSLVGRAIAQTQSPPAQTQLALPELLDRVSTSEAVAAIETRWENAYESYFGANFGDIEIDAAQIAEILDRLGRQTGKRSALIYAIAAPKQLELILVLPGRDPIRKSIPEADRETVLDAVLQLRQEITNPRKRNRESYLEPARSLYDWIVRPLKAELEANEISTLLFCVGNGLRTLPFAALHDGERFLIEEYGFTRIPAFKWTDTLYGDLRESKVLAMGASQFEELSPLPAVPVELAAIAGDLWSGRVFLNNRFTLENLRSQVQENDYRIVHLATHAEFKPGDPSNSFIQLWNEKLTLDRMRQLGFDTANMSLLVLSACKTAFGDEDVELGFAGLAVQSGVKTALASLWYVSDAGTLALMSEFYRALRATDANGQPKIKAEALREAQIAMIRGRVRVEGSQLRGSGEEVDLPPTLQTFAPDNLSHPYYWAAFTAIGSPW
jgi:CHAT domain-containing protein